MSQLFAAVCYDGKTTSIASKTEEIISFLTGLLEADKTFFMSVGLNLILTTQVDQGYADRDERPA